MDLTFAVASGSFLISLDLPRALEAFGSNERLAELRNQWRARRELRFYSGSSINSRSHQAETYAYYLTLRIHPERPILSEAASCRVGDIFLKRGWTALDKWLHRHHLVTKARDS